MLLVTGGENYPDYLDSTELLVPGSGSWRLATGLLPRPMCCMRVATVANTLYLTGIELLLQLYCTNVCIQVDMIMTIVTRSWSSALTPRTGAWLAAWSRLDMITPSPTSSLKTLTNIAIDVLHVIYSLHYQSFSLHDTNKVIGHEHIFPPVLPQPEAGRYPSSEPGAGW